MTTKNFVPRMNGEGNIGTSVKRWLKGWFNSVNVSGDVEIGGNFILPDSGVQALCSKNGNNKFFPITSSGDMWLRSSCNWSVDADNFYFRSSDSVVHHKEVTQNGETINHCNINAAAHQIKAGATVTDFTPYFSDLNNAERYRVRYDLNDTYIQLTGGSVAATASSYILSDTTKALRFGTDGRSNDMSLDSSGEELKLMGPNGTRNNRLKLKYSGSSGHARIGPDSNGGSTQMYLGACNSGVWHDVVYIGPNQVIHNYPVHINQNDTSNLTLTNANSACALLDVNSTALSYEAASMQRLNNHSSGSSNWHFLQCSSSNYGDLEFSIRGDGNAWADGSWNAGGADFAEYFEWSDGNPQDEDRRGWSVVLENGKIRKALATEMPFGVISSNPTVVGDAAEFKWADKYLRDDFGSYVMEEYASVEWMETKIIQAATEAIYQKVVKEREVQATETVSEEVCSIQLIDGKYTKTVKTETKEILLFDEFDLYEEGQIVGIHRVPRMVTETYDVEELVTPAQEEQTEDVRHSYAVDQVPDGLIVPENATQTTQQRRKLNPDYIETQEYIARSERPEWDCVGLMGKLRLIKGEVTHPNWIKMRDISETIEEWLVK
jgi:hypothetical protein